MDTVDKSHYLRCRECGVEKTCGGCFETSTIAEERLLSGARSGICKVCYAKLTGSSEESVPLDIRMDIQQL